MTEGYRYEDEVFALVARDFMAEAVGGCSLGKKAWRA
jgi:hypothetical protein